MTMPEVYDVSGGEHEDDKRLNLDGGAKVSKSTAAKRKLLRPSPLENPRVQTMVSILLGVIVVAAIASLIIYFLPKGNKAAENDGNEPKVPVTRLQPPKGTAPN